VSADNWAVCPRCTARRLTEVARLQGKADAAYGVVSVAEFDALRSAAEEMRNQRPEPTFREDYEFYGVEDGILHISYSGGCKVCGLTHKVVRAEPLTLDELGDTP